MHQHRRAGVGSSGRQEGDEPVHLRDGLAGRYAILLRPALDLALHIAGRAPEIAQAGGCRIDLVQPRQRGVQAVIDGGALRCRNARHMGFPEHPAGDEVHDIEGSADHRAVLAQEMQKLADTQLEYQTVTSLYMKSMALLKTAVGKR